MIKNLSFAAALLSLALATGCAVGGSGPCAVNCAGISIQNTSAGLSNVSEAPVGGATIQFTATPSNLSSNTVTWSISPTTCGSACGTITSTGEDTATYTSPSTVPSSNSAITITATSQSNPSVSGTYPITIVNITTSVAPVSPKVGQGLGQEFTAIASPDNAPQTFGTWTCSNSAGDCSSELTACSGVVGACMTYTPATAETKVQINAPPPGSAGCGTSNANCTAATPTVVTNRVSGTYGFQFSGYDTNGRQVLAAGTFTATASGTGATISGTEDQISWNGAKYAPTTGISISSSSYTATSNDSGTLKLNGNTFDAVLNGNGDIQLAEAGGNGIYYGVAEPASKTSVTKSAVFAFGLTGVEANQSTPVRVGYAGLFGINGSPTSALLDTNDNGQTTNICGTSPCSVTATFTFSASTNQGTLTLTSGSWSQSFDLFGGKGDLTASNPLTLYAISTTVGATNPVNPALLGEVQFQAPPTNKSGVYDNSAFNGTSVSVLTGVSESSSVVSLTLGTTDGTSGGTGGTGNFSGQFDQNDAGMILTYPAPNANPAQPAFSYTYLATNGSTGRYTFQMLGNPAASPVLAPLPFVLYASGPNRGFLLDENSTAVMTGTMTPQKAPTQTQGIFFNAAMVGTYAAATFSNSLPSGCSLMPSCAVAANLLLTSPGSVNNQAPTFPVNGTENGATISGGSYNIVSSGTGTLSATVNSNAANYVLYAIDETDFYLIEEDSKVPSPVLFMSQ
jgi:hypothetical protein